MVLNERWSLSSGGFWAQVVSKTGLTVIFFVMLNCWIFVPLLMPLSHQSPNGVCASSLEIKHPEISRYVFNSYKIWTTLTSSEVIELKPNLVSLLWLAWILNGRFPELFSTVKALAKSVRRFKGPLKYILFYLWVVVCLYGAEWGSWMVLHGAERGICLLPCEFAIALI